ncbi:F-box/kelch-repeat protein At3g23880-like [Corylus avellana]|uniref:F-box/kelch-repeat protein At3g23880-like n=1 Tax=Corylus avellana TaxID=13451 RepID=UPI00286A1E20|nr:F-box/kelch-repeat protein At3g23880-like [Corylus avellana]
MLIRRLKLLLSRLSLISKTRRRRRRRRRRFSKKEKVNSLPNEVVEEILIRLPVKSLVRFRCVCKDWFSLISSNAFIAAHTSRALSRSDYINKSNRVLFRYVGTVFLKYFPPRHFQYFSLRSDDGSFGRNRNFIHLKYPFDITSTLDILPNIVGSWNALFCFAYDNPYRRYGYSLWNPSIHRALSLPDPNFTLWSKSLHICKHFHGFGYDPSTNDVKLVRLAYHGLPIPKVPPLVEIYTLNTGCWRAITSPAPSYIVRDRCLSVFVNRASHWVALTAPGERTFRNVIVAFDMGDEVFREIAMPNCFVGKFYLNMTVAVRDGLLCLVPFNQQEQEQSVSLWIMKEYGIGESWTKLFNIHISGLKRVVAFRQNGEVLVTNRNVELLSYEPNIQRVTQIKFCKFSSSEIKTRFVECLFFWDKYLESLVLLNAKDGVSGGTANTSYASARKGKFAYSITSLALCTSYYMLTFFLFWGICDELI